jgi:hypothetical protein
MRPVQEIAIKAVNLADPGENFCSFVGFPDELAKPDRSEDLRSCQAWQVMSPGGCALP